MEGVEERGWLLDIDARTDVGGLNEFIDYFRIAMGDVISVMG